MKNWIAFVGYLEGFSFLTLMFYAMPMKYFAGEPEMVSLFGGLHGGLFVAYIFLLFIGVGKHLIRLRPLLTTLVLRTFF